LEKEVIHKSDIEKLMGPRPFVEKGTKAADEESQTNSVIGDILDIPPVPSTGTPSDEEQV